MCARPQPVLLPVAHRLGLRQLSRKKLRHGHVHAGTGSRNCLPTTTRAHRGALCLTQSTTCTPTRHLPWSRPRLRLPQRHATLRPLLRRLLHLHVRREAVRGDLPRHHHRSDLLAAIIVAIRFVLQGRRTTQQEKPLFFVLACLVMVGVGYVVRLAVGRSIGCGRTEEGKAYVLASGGDVPQPGCLAVFFLLYYFGLAANCWWLTLTFTWFCSAVQGGKKQQINGLLKRCHIFAWLIPALMVALAVALKFVDSGM